MLLTKRERLLRTFKGMETDRVAVSPFIWTNFVNEFYKMNMSPADEKLDERLINVYKNFDFDIMHRTCTIWDAFSNQYLDSKNWRVTIEENKTSEKQRKLTTTIRTPEKELTEVKEFRKTTEYDEISAETEHFIKTPEDFEQFIKYQPPVPKFDCSRIARANEMLGDDGITAPWVSGVFNTASRHLKIDSLLMDAYEDPDFYNGIMEYFTQRQIATCIQFANAGADVLTFEGNIANGSMVGPNYFETNILAYEKRIIKAIQESGPFVLYHNCGDTNAMFDVYNRLGLDALETLTEKPFGDTDIDHALLVLNNNITVIGNIDQIEFLRTASRGEIRERVKSLLEKFKTRRKFILGTSDYISEGTSYENIKTFSDAGREFGAF